MLAKREEVVLFNITHHVKALGKSAGQIDTVGGF